MLLPLNWLREFVPYAGTGQELADRLTMLGLEVEEIKRPFEGCEEIVIGHVVERVKHPEADKLSLTRVDVGGEVLDIVCGAPNVDAGQKVAVAKIGATLPGGLTIKKAKIRGAASHGMICSERELGLSEDHSGIMVLDAVLKPGTNFMDAMGLEREVLNVDLTPNRGDCLSILGLAREIAMVYGLPLTMPGFELKETAERATDVVRVEIPEPEYCPLYQARVLRGVSMRQSPAWMRYRLLAMGQRPISGVVDVTNYVMLEMGQPLHAFDAATLKGGVIRVARATDGMEFVTLDGQNRKLLASDLLIWDGEKPVALAGVMGGENTEVSDATTEVVLECAVFRPGTIRKTARRLGLPSEASHRFERGVDQEGSHLAVDRAAALMAEVAGGEVLSGVSLAEPRPWERPTLRYRHKRACAVLGIELSPAFAEATLAGMGCAVREADTPEWTVIPPSHRLDLEREIDLVEEVGRVYGLDRIPESLPRVSKDIAVGHAETEYAFVSRVKHWARGAGLAEAVNYSFVGDRDLDVLNLPAANRVRIANPLSEDQCVLRTAVIAGLLQNLRLNISQGSPDLRLFEVAKTYECDTCSETTACETVRLNLLLHGARFFGGHPWDAEEKSDYTDLKGLVTEFLRAFRLPAPDCVTAAEHPFLSPCVDVRVNGRPIGVMGRVRPEVAANAKARADVWAADLDLDAVRALAGAVVLKFRDLPKFPPIRRDVTLVAEQGVGIGRIIEAALAARVGLLESVACIDEYQPEGSGARNLTFRMTYRSPSKTLKDEEADKAHGKVTAALLEALPVKQQQ